VTLVERVTERLGRVCARVIVVAQAALVLPTLPPEVLVLRDPLPDAGPLVGLSAGLDALDASTPWAFVCAVDVPFVSALVVARLHALRDDFEAVVPRIGGDTYPLTAIYARSLAVRARDLVASGERRARLLAQSARTRFVDRDDLLLEANVAEPHIVETDSRLATFLNVNTRADWERAQALARELDVTIAVDGREPKRD
jgi:molybdopterin-guanine dinucleotide biosynthesis protein A